MTNKPIPYQTFYSLLSLSNDTMGLQPEEQNFDALLEIPQNNLRPRRCCMGYRTLPTLSYAFSFTSALEYLNMMIIALAVEVFDSRLVLNWTH